MATFDYSKADFDQSPMIVFYETTRACDLMCLHCRADAQKVCDPRELTTAQSKKLIDQLKQFPKPPLLVLTGGDPLKRPDIFELTEYAVKSGLEVAMTPSATPLVTREAIQRLKQIGLHRFAVSLDGCDAATHDGFRQVAGSFQRTMEIISDARASGLPVQINTTVARHNVAQLDAIAELLSHLDIVMWSIFFLIPTGRATMEQRLDADEVERVFETLWKQSRVQKYAIKSTEAPHYRRFLLQKQKGMRDASAPPVRRSGAARIGTNDGKGVMFVSHIGEIFPSGFLPIECGQFPLDSVVRVYQSAKLFQSLRDADQLGGKCGPCEFREICGGSRARALSVTGDPLAAEPDCAFISDRVITS